MKLIPHHLNREEESMQKFQKYDYVRVAKDLGRSMEHFTSNCDAIILYSYADKFGGKDTNSYAIHIENKGETAWYNESQLTLIERDRKDILDIWNRQEKELSKKQSNLDWIFSNGEYVLTHASGATITALAGCFGLTNLWGNRGEGFTYYENAVMTLILAKPFLENKDKDGWVKYCKTMVLTAV